MLISFSFSQKSQKTPYRKNVPTRALHPFAKLELPSQWVFCHKFLNDFGRLRTASLSPHTPKDAFYLNRARKIILGCFSDGRSRRRPHKRVSPFFLSFFSYVRHIRRRQKVVLTCLRPIPVFSALHDRQRRAAPLRTGAYMKKKKVGTYGRVICFPFTSKIV
jgi:hypothetical protein